jgi:hypothetical protein
LRGLFMINMYFMALLSRCGRLGMGRLCRYVGGEARIATC